MKNNKGILYLVPSPIGNLNEVSKRVVDILNNVDYISCEDTRNTDKFLSLINIKKKTFSCHEHNEKESSIKIVNDLLDGKNIAYLSDAGYPCISDPGYLLVKEAVKNNIQICPLSGPNALLNGLVGSSIDPTHFLFYGFLKSKESERKNELELLKDLPYTIIFYESPHRINDTLKTMLEILGNRNICICRELTKLHEEFIRTDLETINKKEQNLIGEMVIVIEGKIKIETEEVSDEEIISKVDELVKNGLTKKDAILSISILYKINKNRIKKLVL